VISGSQGPRLVEEKASFEEEFGHGSRLDPKTTLTVMARQSTIYTIRSDLTQPHRKQTQFNINNLMFTFLDTSRKDATVSDRKNYLTSPISFKNIISIYFRRFRLFELEASEIRDYHNGVCEVCCVLRCNTV
jgi:hypothetical protein